jgi:NitT/TauT family transport system substrate-binding protein
MYTTKDFVQRHPEIVAKFVHASVKGWKEYLNDPVPANALIAKLNPALNPEWMQFTWQQLKDGHFVAGEDPTGAQIGQMDPKRWATMYEQLVDLKMIAKPINPTTAYTLQFLGPQ